MTVAGGAAIIPRMKSGVGLDEITGALIDFTTGHWPAACPETIGQPWLAPPPPAYLWTFGTRLPAGVRYIPDRDAIDLVVAILALQGRDYP